MPSHIYARVYVDDLDSPLLLDAAEDGARHLHLKPWLELWAKKHDPDDRGRLLAGAGRAATPRAIARSVPCVRAEDIAGCIAELTALDVLGVDDEGVPYFVEWRAGGAPGGAAAFPSQTREAKAEQKRRERLRQQQQQQQPPQDGQPTPPRGGGAPAPVATVASEVATAVASDMPSDMVTTEGHVASDGNASLGASLMSPGTSKRREEEKRVETTTTTASADAREPTSDTPIAPPTEPPADIRPVPRVPVTAALKRYPRIAEWVAGDEDARRRLVSRLAVRVLEVEGNGRETVFAYVGELAMLLDGARGTKLTDVTLHTGLADFLNANDPVRGRPPLSPIAFRAFFRGAANEPPVAGAIGAGGRGGRGAPAPSGPIPKARVS